MMGDPEAQDETQTPHDATQEEAMTAPPEDGQPAAASGPQGEPQSDAHPKPEPEPQEAQQEQESEAQDESQPEAPLEAGPEAHDAAQEEAQSEREDGETATQEDASVEGQADAPDMVGAPDPTDTHEPAQTDAADAAPEPSLLYEIELEATLQFGSREMLLSEVMALGPGAVVELDRHVSEPVDLVVGDRIVARGEVVIASGNFALHITEVATPQLRLEGVQWLL